MTDVVARSVVDELCTRLTEEPVVARGDDGRAGARVAPLVPWRRWRARIKVCPKQTVDSFLPNGWMIDEQRVRIMISEKGLLGHAI